MPDLLWKAVGRDWTSRGGVRWAVGETAAHPTSTAMVQDDVRTYLSLSDEPAETLIGCDWPCRLLRVEPVSDVIRSDLYPHKRCALRARVVAEVEPWRALGPNGREAAAVIARCGRLTTAEARRLAAARNSVRQAAWRAAWGAAGTAAWVAARGAAWTAAGTAVWVAAGGIAGDVAPALAANCLLAPVARDLIPSDTYDALAAPLVSVVGPLDELPVPAWVDEPVPAPDTWKDAHP